MASEDTEITLGVGRLLGLFFLLSALCGVFFSIGYSLGKSTAREQALNDQPTSVLAASPPATAATGAQRRKAFRSRSCKIGRRPASPGPDTTSNSQNNLTFYKAVQQNGANAEPAAKDNAPAATQKAPAQRSGRRECASTQPRTPAKLPAAPRRRPATLSPVTGPGTIVVQIAALSREDDAVSLAGALRKKSYNVIVVNNPATNDKFYHVQVGPFATMQEADAMKAKLTAEGYNPIVKR